MTSTSRPTPEQFLESVSSDSHAFAAAARKGLDAAVPTCPGWTVRDLLVHTGVIHRRKQQVINKGLTDRETEVEEPQDDPVVWFEEGVSLMLAALRSKSADEHAWSWFEPDQTVGFWQRRMAHETLVHRVDAELSHGDISAVDPGIAEDGIGEALEVFIAGYPDWATLKTGQSVIKLSTPNRSWLLRVGSFSGTTKSGRVLTDFPTVMLEPTVEKWDCEISGDPATLNLWLWGRAPSTNLDISGDTSLADYLRDVASKST